jgi:hypothetical protein
VGARTVTGETASEDIDVYNFDVIRGDSIVLSVRELTHDGGFSPYLDLVSPEGRLIAGGALIRLSCIEETGRFQVLCRDSDFSGSGRYELSLQQTPLPPPLGSPPEHLAAFICDDSVVIRWSTNAAGFTLQQTDLLNTNAALINWSNVPAPYAEFAGFNYLTNFSSNAPGFFRLIRPVGARP